MPRDVTTHEALGLIDKLRSWWGERAGSILACADRMSNVHIGHFRAIGRLELPSLNPRFLSRCTSTWPTATCL